MTTATNTPAVPRPAGLTDAATATIAAKTGVDCYTHALLAQPPFGLAAVPHLDDHLAQAQANADTWVTRTSPEMVRRITDIVGFADVWAGFSPSVAQKVKDRDTAGAVRLLQVMKDSHLAPLSSDAQGSATAVGDLQVRFLEDAGNFTEALTRGHAAYQGDDGVIAKAKEHEDALQRSMSNMTTLIAGGAVAVVTGGLVVAVGLLLEFPTAGASTVVVAGGLALVVGGALAIGAGAVEYNDMLGQYRSTLLEVAQDNAEMGLLTAMEGRVGSLATANGGAQSALLGLATSWTALQSDLDHMITDLGAGIHYPDVVLEELAAADREWALLATTATALADNVGVPRVQVNLGQNAAVVVRDPSSPA